MYMHQYIQFIHFYLSINVWKFDIFNNIKTEQFETVKLKRIKKNTHEVINNDIFFPKVGKFYHLQRNMKIKATYMERNPARFIWEGANKPC